MPAKNSRALDLWLVALCLVFSGAGSLVLEVVWSRSLKLVFGSTTLAIATILVAYMLGLGLGGLFGGRIAKKTRSGVRIYGLFEMAIAIYAIGVPHVLDLLPWVNATFLADLGFWPSAMARFTIVLLFLLLPTLMMGATLPILVAALAREHGDLARRVGLLYGMNTLGAVVGVVGATFVLFPWLGLYKSNLFGAGLDFSVGAVAAFVLAPRLARRAAEAGEGRAGSTIETSSKQALHTPRPRRFSLPVLSYALVGFTSLAYEVSWTRALAMITGASIYAFAVMLAAFLTGIALGSLFFRRYFDRLKSPQAAYALGLAVLGILALGTMLSFGMLPGLFVTLIKTFGLEGSTVVIGALVVSFLAMLGPTLILGALFPLLIRSVVEPGGDTSRVVADVYFINTIGSASGAFAAGFLFIPLLGLQTTMALLMAINFATAAVILMWQSQWRGRARTAFAAALGVAAVLVVAFPPFWDATRMTKGVYYTPDEQLTFGLELEEYEGLEIEEMLYYKDGLNTTVSIHRSPGGVNLRLGGKPDASLGDMSTQTLSGHIPMLFGPPATKALVIGYASGVTTGAVALYEPERVDVVELEPAVMEASRFFDPYNHAPQENPRVRVIVDDGRSFLHTTDEIYDVIISEPSNPWISGASNLFTREYFELAREHLAANGRLLQWIQLYGMDGEALQSVWRAVRAEFPYVYGFLANTDDVDFLMLATNEPLSLEDLPLWEHIPEPAREDMRRVQVFSTGDLWSLMQITPGEIDSLIGDLDGPINTDDSMLVELRAPWTIYNDAFEHLGAIERFESGLLGVLDEDERARVPPRLLGELAHSYITVRRNSRIGQVVLQAAVARGRTGAASAAVAEAILRDGTLEPGERNQRAQAVLEEGLALDPQDPLARSLRARLRYSAGDLPGALDDINVALAVDPRRFPMQQLRVRILGGLGRVREAWEEAQTILARNLADLHAGLYADSAPAAAASGEFEKALELMTKFLEVNPHAEREWQIVAQIHEDLGDRDAALAANANAERARRNFTVLLHRAALRHAHFGSAKRAIEILEGVVARDPSNVRARDEIARLRRGERL